MSGSRLETAMHALLLCKDAQFLGTTQNVLQQIGGTPRVVDECGRALVAIEAQKFDVIVLDWREIDDMAEFLWAVKRSALNHDCVLVAIVRDVLDVRQAFTAGVHFLIHKPASIVQIERCLHTAYLAFDCAAAQDLSRAGGNSCFRGHAECPGGAGNLAEPRRRRRRTPLELASRPAGCEPDCRRFCLDQLPLARDARLAARDGESRLGDYHGRGRNSVHVDI